MEASSSNSMTNVTVTSDAKQKKRTLTNLYPNWLELVRQWLDQAVFAAYGWKSTLSAEEILEKLLALNLERARA
jgi:hypothetical protein